VTPVGSPVRRRVVLRAGTGMAGLVVAAALGGCGEEDPVVSAGARTPSADDVALARVRVSAARLAASARELAAADPTFARVLGAVVADHQAHLAALGVAASTSASTSTSTSASTSASTSVPPSGSASPSATHVGVAALVSAETAAAQEALDDARDVTAGLAALLARIAAARATHADLLTAKAGLRRPPTLRTSSSAPQGAVRASPAPLPGAAAAPVPSDAGSAVGAAQGGLSGAAREALAAVTAGEHAAVYAYGAVAAVVAARERDRAQDAWSWHIARRDGLEERLLAAGVRPPAAAPAYELGAPLSATAAAALAATVEDRLATLGARTVAATSGPDRSDAAEALVAGARRAAAWRGSGDALPG
jgi:hypothetical protein